jgi:polysaccharide export outer membrane protein
LRRTFLGLSLGAIVGSGCTAGPQGFPQNQIAIPERAVTSPALAEINRTLTSATPQSPASSVDYQLGAEDVLQITLFNVPEGTTGVTPRVMEVRVSQQGVITLPLLGDIPVAGMTTSAVEQILRSRYEKYLRHPQVGIHVRDYRGQPVSVIGAVRNPGVFTMAGPRKITDLLAMAGGLSGDAGSQVHVYRQNADGRQSYVIDLLAFGRNGDLANMQIQAGDTINVPQAGMYFLDGAVSKPGSYSLGQPYTLTQALARGGGVNFELAKQSDISIFRRREGLEFDRIPINLDEIRAGQAPDAPIAADDVIVVPVSTPKYLVRRFLGSIGMGSIPTFPPL